MASQRPVRLLVDTQIAFLQSILTTQDVKIEFEERVLSMLQSSLEHKETTDHVPFEEVGEAEESNSEQMMNEGDDEGRSDPTMEVSERVEMMVAETRAYQERQQQTQGNISDAVLETGAEGNDGHEDDDGMGNIDEDSDGGGAGDDGGEADDEQDGNGMNEIETSGDESTESDSDTSFPQNHSTATPTNVGLKSQGAHNFQHIDSDSDFDVEAFRAAHVKPKYGGKAPTGDPRERLFCDHPGHPYLCKHQGLMSETEGSESDSNNSNDSTIDDASMGHSSDHEPIDGSGRDSGEDQTAVEEQKERLRIKIAEKEARLANLKACRDQLHEILLPEISRLTEAMAKEEKLEELQRNGYLTMAEECASNQKVIQDFVAKYDTTEEVREEVEEKAEGEDTMATEATEGQLATLEVQGAAGTSALATIGDKKRDRDDDEGDMGMSKKSRKGH